MAFFEPPLLLLWLLTSAFVIQVIISVVYPEYSKQGLLSNVVFLLIASYGGLCCIWYLAVYPFWISPLRHLPHPPMTWRPGAQGYATFSRPAGKYYLDWITNIPNDGLILFRDIFHRNQLLLTNPKTLAEVLVLKSYDFEKPKEVRDFLRVALGDGLVVVEGEEHKFQRKHASPAFNYRHIKELYPIFWAKALELVECVAAESCENNGVVEVNHWASKVTLDIIGLAGLGRDFNALKASDDELVKNYEVLLDPTPERVVYFTLNVLFSPRIVKLLLWKVNRIVSQTTSNLRTICRNLVQDKKAHVGRQEGSKDILSLLIASNNFADDQLVDQLLTFLAAGHETTSSAFTWATYLLAINPSAQRCLRSEVRAALLSSSVSDQASSPKDTSALIESLPYLHGVCSETLRLYPTVPATVRRAIRPTMVGSVQVPQGTHLHICPWAVNRDPHLWGPDASQFVPERWIDPDTSKANNHGGSESNYSSLTFLHGPRSCIGERFARGELKALVAAFVGRFEWELADKDEAILPAGVVTTKPRNGMHLQIKRLES